MKRLGRCGAAALALLCLLAGCGGGGMPAPGGPSSTASVPGQTPGSEAQGSYQAPPMATSGFDPQAAYGEGGALLDTSHTAEGYVAASAQSGARLKFQVILGEMKYNYDLPGDGTPTVFPLQMGSGSYTFRVMQQNASGKYAKIYERTEEVQLQSEFEPFLRPSQMVDYDAASACVAKAKELAAGAASDADVVAAVYDYLKGHIRYDKEKARTVESGYLPDPDETLATGKGICFDYAALAAAMLRSQGIPTKEMTGYVSPNDLYHAWNMVYLENSGWITVTIELGAGQWDRIDITFAASGTSDEFIGDGSNYTDRYTY